MRTLVQLEDGITLLSGAMFSYTDPEATNATIEDIATSLGMQCRFVGHVTRFYSVAQHSVNVSLLVREDLAFDALMHDAAEAFIGDISTPMKFAVPEIKVLERIIERALAVKFGFKNPMPKEVKRADLQMLKMEKEVITNAYRRWSVLEGIEVECLFHMVDFSSMSPKAARDSFLARFSELKSTA